MSDKPLSSKILTKLSNEKDGTHKDDTEMFSTPENKLSDAAGVVNKKQQTKEHVEASIQRPEAISSSMSEISLGPCVYDETLLFNYHA